MSLPSSGPLSLYAIQQEVGTTENALYVIKEISTLSDKSTPFPMSRFYGYVTLQQVFLTVYITSYGGASAGGYISSNQNIETDSPSSGLNINILVYDEFGATSFSETFISNGSTTGFWNSPQGSFLIGSVQISSVSPGSSSTQVYNY